MAVRRRPATTPKVAPEGAELLLHWDRWKPVPGKWANHEDSDVSYLVAVTADVVRLFRQAAYSETDYEREDAQAALPMAYRRLSRARLHFARRLGLEWTEIEPGGRLVKHQD